MRAWHAYYISPTSTVKIKLHSNLRMQLHNESDHTYLPAYHPTAITPFVIITSDRDRVLEMCTRVRRKCDLTPVNRIR